jgi:hypothetical protein
MPAHDQDWPLLFCAYTWPRLTKKNTSYSMATHTFLPNGFSMFACPHKQKILEEEDWPNEHTHTMFCAHHQNQQPLLPCANLCCFMIAHNQDRPSLAWTQPRLMTFAT